MSGTLELSEQVVVAEKDLSAGDVKPSETYSRLVKIVGDKTSLGGLGLGLAIRQLVREHTA